MPRAREGAPTLAVATSEGAGPLLYAFFLTPAYTRRIRPSPSGRGVGGEGKSQGCTPPFFGLVSEPGDSQAHCHAGITINSPRSGFSRCEKRGHHHPKPDVVVPVIGIVPVAIRAAGVPGIIIVGTAPQHTGGTGPWPGMSSTPPLEVLPCHLGAAPAGRDPRVAGRWGCVVLIQPPSNLPISVTITAACWYWPGVSQFHLAARRRYSRTRSKS